jgi:hypothetical protein
MRIGDTLKCSLIESVGTNVSLYPKYGRVSLLCTSRLRYTGIGGCAEVARWALLLNRRIKAPRPCREVAYGHGGAVDQEAQTGRQLNCHWFQSKELRLWLSVLAHGMDNL